MTSFRDKVAAVTGAGSGIGRALALGLGARGAKLALSDVNPTGLAETEALGGARGFEVDAAVLDVADAAAFETYARAVKAKFGAVHQLYNNAGITTGSTDFLAMRPRDFDQILQVNYRGVVNATRALLPLLIESGAGALVNISSLNGLMAQAKLSAYCASKFAVRGFTEAIRTEMLLAGHPVQVVVVHPGGVKTNIANSGLAPDIELTPEERAQAERRIRFYNEKLLTMAPEEAARLILDGVAKGRSRIVITRTALWLDRLIRLTPERYPRRVAALQKRMSVD